MLPIVCKMLTPIQPLFKVHKLITFLAIQISIQFLETLFLLLVLISTINKFLLFQHLFTKLKIKFKSSQTKQLNLLKFKFPLLNNLKYIVKHQSLRTLLFFLYQNQLIIMIKPMAKLLWIRQEYLKLKCMLLIVLNILMVFVVDAHLDLLEDLMEFVSQSILYVQLGIQMELV